MSSVIREQGLAAQAHGNHPAAAVPSVRPCFGAGTGKVHPHFPGSASVCLAKLEKSGEAKVYREQFTCSRPFMAACGGTPRLSSTAACASKLLYIFWKMRRLACRRSFQMLTETFVPLYKVF